MTDRDRRNRFIVNIEDLIITPPGGTPPPVAVIPPAEPEDPEAL
jgi:hypothetical protein